MNLYFLLINYIKTETTNSVSPLFFSLSKMQRRRLYDHLEDSDSEQDSDSGQRRSYSDYMRNKRQRLLEEDERRRTINRLTLLQKDPKFAIKQYLSPSDITNLSLTDRRNFVEARGREFGKVRVTSSELNRKVTTEDHFLRKLVGKIVDMELDYDGPVRVRLPYLKKLHVRNCNDFSFLRDCPRLETLTVERCTDLDNIALVRESLTRLHLLRIEEGVEDDEIQESLFFLRRTTNLSSITIESCATLDLDYIADDNNLRDVTIIGDGYSIYFPQYWDDNTKLKELNIQNVIFSDSLPLLPKSLERLTLVRCEGLSDFGNLALCPELRQLVIRELDFENTFFPDGDLPKLATLEVLSIIDTPGMPDISNLISENTKELYLANTEVKHIPANIALKQITLINCVNFDYRHLYGSNPNLEKLVIRNSRVEISEEIVNNIIDNKNSLRYINMHFKNMKK